MAVKRGSGTWRSCWPPSSWKILATCSDKKIKISVDEWNVWRISEWNAIEHGFDPGDWPLAPEKIEDVYTAADALAVGGLLISLLRHADRVKAACLAQLVNVIAPII